MAQGTVTAGLGRTQEKVASAKTRIDAIRNNAETARPEIEAAAQGFEEALDSVLDFADSLARDTHAWPTVKRFIRRILSREFIIVVVSIIAIWAGDLGAQESIAVGAAGSGLALGRGVAKNRSGNES